MKKKLPVEAIAFSPVLEAHLGDIEPCKGVQIAEELFKTITPDSAGGFEPIEIMRKIGDRAIGEIRADFPMLRGDIVWLDNASTTQKPQIVIDRLCDFYSRENSNIKRGAHILAARADVEFERSREIVAAFIGAKSKNIVFTRGATEAINLAAQSIVKPRLKKGDEIVITLLEHHANIVPWQMIAAEKGAILRVAPVDSSGQIDIGAYRRLFSPRTKFAAVCHISNALGTILPIDEMCEIAHLAGAKILVDAAQSISHIKIDVSQSRPDLLVFSGHKVYAPFGIGALYASDEMLEDAKPYHGGGNMIADVTFSKTLYQKAPNRFEAGTMSVADAIALGTALTYISSIGIENIEKYERSLMRYAMSEMRRVEGLHLIGAAENKAGALSFVIDRFSIDLIAGFLDSKKIACRAGHHCAQPILRFFGLNATVRPSIALYNNHEEIEYLVKCLKELVKQ